LIVVRGWGSFVGWQRWVLGAGVLVLVAFGLLRKMGVSFEMRAGEVGLLVRIFGWVVWVMSLRMMLA
ncbi:hypothetical protein RA275_29865, partial [Pseudomonas syringae pv. tagetis]